MFRSPMTKRQKVLTVALAVLIVLAVGAYGFFLSKTRTANSRESLLALLPTDRSAVVYLDVGAFRQSPMLPSLLALVPAPARDSQYAQFVKDTGFDYERDIDQLAAALDTRGNARRLFAVVDGHFDQEKLVGYALRTGRKEIQAGHDVYLVPASPDFGELSFAFLNRQRIVLANTSKVGEELSVAEKTKDHDEWTSRFERLSGSPVFALLRQNASPGEALIERAPGGFTSPQLASLLNRLEWISLASRPVGTHLQVVAEGESATDETARQLSEFLGGAVILAEAGLNDPKLRAQMPESSRTAILDLVKSFDVSRLDRGTSKSVRLVFQVPPDLLALAMNVPKGEKPQAIEPLVSAPNEKGAGAPKKNARH